MKRVFCDCCGKEIVIKAADYHQSNVPWTLEYRPIIESTPNGVRFEPGVISMTVNEVELCSVCYSAVSTSIRECINDLRNCDVNEN